MALDFDGIALFVAVAEERGFRAAGRRLGVSGSAVSQRLRQLEERLGVVLAYRTTRSVRLTPAGEQLLQAVKPALREVEAAVAEVTEQGDEPRGTLRLKTVSAAAAESVLSAEVLAGFLAAYPAVRLEITVSQRPGDIVSAGFDAGVALGEVIEPDMIAMPVTDPIRLLVVGAPSYFAHHAPPAHPRDLVAHTCINWRAGREQPAYRWDFTEKKRDFAVAVEARVLTNDPTLNLQLALAGAGLTMARESRVRQHIERGELVAVLEEYCPPFPGMYLYYPRRRHAPPALRVFIDYLRANLRSTAGPGDSLR